ncbi:MAG: ATP-binding protein [Anaerolineales bacterium]
MTHQTDLATSPEPTDSPQPANMPRSLRDLIDRVTGRGLTLAREEDAGIAEVLPFPFFALVGQDEMKLALLLSLVNPAIGGVLLIGPRGTGKTTAVRSLVNLMPLTPRSLCFYGCLPEDIETGGIDAVCPECAQKYGRGEPLTRLDTVRLVELPLNARIEDVVGGIDERAAIHERLRLRRGILAQADHNVLYVDEVNLLADDLTDAILDAAAQGLYTVRRGPVSATYRARFTLIGSMNPEEGRLRPQILDRFGLRIVVRGLTDTAQRLEAYRRVRAYLTNPRGVIAAYWDDTLLARDEIQTARNLLPKVTLTDEVARYGLNLIQRLQIDSLRAEITLFEAARAYAAADARDHVTPADLHQIAPMTLRLRRSAFMNEYFNTQQAEEDEIQHALNAVLPSTTA